MRTLTAQAWLFFHDHKELIIHTTYTELSKKPVMTKTFQVKMKHDIS